ncbi:MAG: YfbM family protein [Planctomycetota bacterium]|nr:YfbM family protein [Planctomycetota bacterium]
MWGYLHRVPADRLSELLSNPSQIEDELYSFDVKRLPECTVEKTWNAIEFILDRLAESDRIPLIGPLTEGEKTGIAFDYGECWFRTPAEVKQIADALGGLSKEEFKKGYMPNLMTKHNVYPNIWDREEDYEENFEYVWEWYKGLVEFYQEAAAKGEGMLLHIG